MLFDVLLVNKKTNKKTSVQIETTSSDSALALISQQFPDCTVKRAHAVITLEDMAVHYAENYNEYYEEKQSRKNRTRGSTKKAWYED